MRHQIPQQTRLPGLPEWGEGMEITVKMKRGGRYWIRTSDLHDVNVAL